MAECEVFPKLLEIQHLPRCLSAIIANYDERTEEYAIAQWLRNFGEPMRFSLNNDFHVDLNMDIYPRSLYLNSCENRFFLEVNELFTLANRRILWLNVVSSHRHYMITLHPSICKNDLITLLTESSQEWSENLRIAFEQIAKKELDRIENEFILGIQLRISPWLPK